MNINKILGYVLIVGGLLVIGFALFQSYNIFTAKISAPLVFKTQAIPETEKNNNNLSLDELLQKQIEETVGKQVSQMLGADTLPKLLNLISWSILAGILILGGGQIAGIGTKMIK